MEYVGKETSVVLIKDIVAGRLLRFRRKLHVKTLEGEGEGRDRGVLNQRSASLPPQTPHPDHITKEEEVRGWRVKGRGKKE